MTNPSDSSAGRIRAILNDSTSTDPALLPVAEKVLGGQRLTPADGLLLFEKAEVGFTGMLANYVREKLHGNKTYYNRNFHIEPTNVCVFACHFCSYSRLYKHREEGWELTREEMMRRVREYDGKPVTEVHIVGGVHPKMDLHYFAGLLREIRDHRPGLHIKAFTAVELHYMFRKANVSTEEGFRILADNGLGSIPGGGAEIFDPVIREQICADKCTAAEWLDIHRTAHRAGLHSNATILYGHLESFAHRMDHLEQLRRLQDETGGFNAFIPLKFRNQNNAMSDIAEVSVAEDLRNYAISRLYLDNIPHLKAYWPMIGRNTAQLSQSFGVDDLDGTIDDSTKIYSMAGAEEQTPVLTTAQIRELILQGGREPVERDTLYRELPAEALPGASPLPA
jgi:aminodeoxyfutalosine synthase